MIRTLTFSTLYPSGKLPHHGIFVEQRLRHLLQSGQVVTQVVAPVPWFPISHQSMGEYSLLASIPRKENRHGIDIVHPRYPLIPKIGMTVTPLLMAIMLRAVLKRYMNETPFDLIDAHYLYPDGVAAALMGKWLNRPVVITARGTDVNLIPEYTIPRKWILWAADHCHGVITVSDALRDRLIELGVSSAKIRTLRNGVDLKFFKPVTDRQALRENLGMKGMTLVSVGHLIERKGHHLAIQAVAETSDVSLVIAGSGPMHQELLDLATQLKVADRIRFVGSLTHHELVEYYNASDALVLASSREGMANVLLESIACGNPVIATPYWGNPEVVADDVAGQLTKDRSVAAIVSAIGELRRKYPDRRLTRRYAEQFGWEQTTQGQLQLFREIAAV